MGEKLRRHFASNVVGYVALVVALMGVPMAWALGKNTVGTKQIKPGAVRSSDVKNDSLTGFDVLESSLGLVPSAQSAVNAQHAENAATADSATNAQSAQNAQNAQNATNATNATNAENATNATNAQSANTAGSASVANNAFNADNANNFAGFGISQFAGIGRDNPDTGSTFCNDDGNVIATGPETCTIDSINLPRSGRVLAILSGDAKAVTLDDTTGPGSTSDSTTSVRGRCWIFVDTAGTITNAPTSELFTAGLKTGFTSVGISPSLSAGDHDFSIVCEEEDGDIDFDNLRYAIVLLGSG